MKGKNFSSLVKPFFYSSNKKNLLLLRFCAVLLYLCASVQKQARLGEVTSSLKFYKLLLPFVLKKAMSGRAWPLYQHEHNLVDLWNLLHHGVPMTFLSFEYASDSVKMVT